MLNKLRYVLPTVHPITATIAVLVLLTVMISAIFTAIGWLRTSEFARATGIAIGADRIYALREALYWSARAAVHDAGDNTIQPTRLYGAITGLTPKGLVVVNVYDGAAIKTREIKLADVVLDNPDRYAQEVVAVRDLNAEFDVYPPSNEVVVWVNRQPWNVQLIVCGAMRPDERPPTNIVDNAFAGYYWRLAKGEK